MGFGARGPVLRGGSLFYLEDVPDLGSHFYQGHTNAFGLSWNLDDVIIVSSYCSPIRYIQVSHKISTSDYSYISIVCDIESK